MLDIAQDIINEINRELLASTQSIMSSKGLGGSDLIKKVGWEFVDDKFVLYTYGIPATGDKDYFFFVDQGRKRFAKRIPPQALLKWMQKKGIRPRNGQTYNSLAYAISNAIFKNGIKGRRYVDLIVESSLDIILENIVVDLTITAAEEISKELEKLELTVKI